MFNIFKKKFEQNWYRILSAILLMVALGSHPIGYYQLLRWVIIIIAGYSSYTAYLADKVSWMWVFIAIAVLFNPISPIYLQKDTWQILDVIASVVFIVSLGVSFNVKK